MTNTPENKKKSLKTRLFAGKSPGNLFFLLLAVSLTAFVLIFPFFQKAEAYTWELYDNIYNYQYRPFEGPQYPEIERSKIWDATIENDFSVSPHFGTPSEWIGYEGGIAYLYDTGMKRLRPYFPYPHNQHGEEFFFEDILEPGASYVFNFQPRRVGNSVFFHLQKENSFGEWEQNILEIDAVSMEFKNLHFYGKEDEQQARSFYHANERNFVIDGTGERIFRLSSSFEGMAWELKYLDGLSVWFRESEGKYLYLRTSNHVLQIDTETLEVNNSIEFPGVWGLVFYDDHIYLLKKWEYLHKIDKENFSIIDVGENTTTPNLNLLSGTRPFVLGNLVYFHCGYNIYDNTFAWNLDTMEKEFSLNMGRYSRTGGFFLHDETTAPEIETDLDFETLPATNITTESAVLWGRINEADPEETYTISFYYGSSPAVGDMQFSTQSIFRIGEEAIGTYSGIISSLPTGHEVFFTIRVNDEYAPVRSFITGTPWTEPPEDYPEAPEETDFPTYYEEQSDEEFTEPLAVFSTIGNFMGNMFGLINPLRVDFAGLVSPGEAYEQGKEAGSIIPQIRGLLIELDPFFGGVPVSTAISIFILFQFLMLGLKIIKTIIHLIPVY